MHIYNILTCRCIDSRRRTMFFIDLCNKAKKKATQVLETNIPMKGLNEFNLIQAKPNQEKQMQSMNRNRKKRQQLTLLPFFGFESYLVRIWPDHFFFLLQISNTEYCVLSVLQSSKFIINIKEINNNNFDKIECFVDHTKCSHPNHKITISPNLYFKRMNE